MKYAKSYLVTLFVLILLLASSLPAFASSFSDTRGHWAQAYIDALVQANVISGYPDGTFRPNAQITRAEFSTILVKGLKLQLKNPGAPSFSDVSPSDWYYPIAETAAAAGLVKGYEGKFWPNTPITREQIVTMLVRALNLAGQAEARQNDPLPFSDAAGISSWARGYVILGKELGLIGGYPDGTFRGSNCATRAEATVMIVKFLQSYGAKVQDPPELTKAFYDSESAVLRLTFDEEIKVGSTDITKIGFQFNNGNSVYFLTDSSKVVTDTASSRVLEIKVSGMPNLSGVSALHVWLKAGAVVDLDGIPIPLSKIEAEFTTVPLPQEQTEENSPINGLLPSGLGGVGDLLEETVDSLTGPLSPVLKGVTEPLGDTLDTVTGLVDDLPLVGGLLDTTGDLLQPVTGLVGGLTGTVLDTAEGLPVVGGIVGGVTDPLLDTVGDVPIVGDLLGAGSGSSSGDGLLQPVTGLVGGLTGTVLDTVGGLPLVGGLLGNPTGTGSGTGQGLPLLGGLLSGLF